MFPYQGSKRKELQHIVDFEPIGFKTFVDVFGGGGSVFVNYLQRDDVKHAVYNDNNPVICDIINTIASGEASAREFMQNATALIPTTRQERIAAIADYKIAPSGEKYLALSASAMRGMVFNPTVGLKKVGGVNAPCDYKISDLTRCCDIFVDGKYTIYNDDYKAILAEYQSDPEAFLYCDPPYVSRASSNDGYGKVDADYLTEIERVMRDPKTRCKILLHVDFTGSNYHHFKDLMRISYSVLYNVRTFTARSRKNETYHMIITNYTDY